MDESHDTDTALEAQLDAIIAELDRRYDHELPTQALREAQRLRKEITPRLIDLLVKATEALKAGDPHEGAGPLFALYLLTEFEAKESLPAIVAALSLPDERPFDLFGDAITEDLGRILAVLATDTIEVIDSLLLKRTVDLYVRWGCAQTYTHLIHAGRLTRHQAIERLSKLLLETIAAGDFDGTTVLVSELVQFGPHEAEREIRSAFARELVDLSIVSFEYAQKSMQEGERRFERAISNVRASQVRDTVEELRTWAAFQPRTRRQTANFPSPKASNLRQPEPADEWEQSITVVNTQQRVGRNEPCPCGSGLKYKKCCLRK